MSAGEGGENGGRQQEGVRQGGWAGGGGRQHTAGLCSKTRPQSMTGCKRPVHLSPPGRPKGSKVVGLFDAHDAHGLHEQVSVCKHLIVCGTYKS